MKKRIIYIGVQLLPVVALIFAMVGAATLSIWPFLIAVALLFVAIWADCIIG